MDMDHWGNRYKYLATCAYSTTSNWINNIKESRTVTRENL